MLNQENLKIIEKALNSKVEVVNGAVDMELIDNSAIYAGELSIEKLSEDGYYYITKMPDSEFVGYVKELL